MTLTFLELTFFKLNYHHGNHGMNGYFMLVQHSQEQQRQLCRKVQETFQAILGTTRQF